MRKIVQIQVTASPQPLLIALCDDGTLWQRPVAPGARWEAIEAIPQAAPQSPKPEAAGKRWLEIDDQELAELWCKHRWTAAAIAERMRRTEGGIIARLVALDFYPDRDTAREEDQARHRQAQEPIFENA